MKMILDTGHLQSQSGHEDQHPNPQCGAHHLDLRRTSLRHGSARTLLGQPLHHGDTHMLHVYPCVSTLYLPLEMACIQMIPNVGM